MPETEGPVVKEYLPTARFTGAKPGQHLSMSRFQHLSIPRLKFRCSGYVFKRGKKGVGYYLDSAQPGVAEAEAAKKAESTEKGEAAGGKQKAPT